MAITPLNELLEMIKNGQTDGFAVIGSPAPEFTDRRLITDKNELVNVPFVLFKAYDRGEYVTMEIVIISTGEVVVFNDGSKGVADQVRKHTAGADVFVTGHEAEFVPPVMVAEGLRVSEYEWTNPKTNKKQPAKTYYLT